MVEQFPTNFLQFPPRLGELLIGEGLLTEEQLTEALAYKDERALFLGQALVELGFLTEEDLVRALRSQHRFEAIHLTPDIVERAVPDDLGYERCCELGVIPINRIAGHVTVAMENPADLLRVQELTGLLRAKLLPVYAQPRRIQEALDVYFGRTGSAAPEPAQEPAQETEAPEPEASVALGVDRGEAPPRAEGEEQDIPQAAQAPPETGALQGSDLGGARPRRASEAEGADATGAAQPGAPAPSAPQHSAPEPSAPEPSAPEPGAPQRLAAEASAEPVAASELLDALVREAPERGTRALHLEATAGGLRVRTRSGEGMLERRRLSRERGQALLEALRAQAGLSPRRSGGAEVVRFTHAASGRRVELELTAVAGAHGACAVVELVGDERAPADLATSGLRAQDRAELAALCDAGDGLLLTAGPVGSGRRSFLRALLAHCATPERLAVALEERPGRPLEQVVELSCEPTGAGTALALRAAWRLQPELVYVGELCDRRTAALAAQAALTGTLVLSSVTSLGALDALQGLRELGLAPHHLADALRAVVGQRLVRRPCPACGVAVEPERLETLTLELPADATLLEIGPGCERCGGSGALGRTALFELLTITPALRERLAASAPLEELSRQAYADGFRDLFDAALASAAVGEVSFSEALARTALGRTRPLAR